MSNLYAQKVFSEHPIAMWSFDEKAGYVTLISEADREVDGWTLTNATSSGYTGLDKTSTPFPASYITQIYPTNEALFQFEAQSPTVWTAGEIYPNVPVSATMFVYIEANSIDYIDFGSTDGVTYTDVTRNYFPDIAEKVWVKVSHNDLQYGKIYFKVVFKDAFASSDYVYLINGLTVGQYSEPVASDMMGITPYNPAGTEDVILDGALPDSASVGWYEELSSGVSRRSGYHVIGDNRLLSYNTSMPIVYGSNYLTKLRPAPTEGAYPSFVFDGCGMFTELGRYDTYTLEFWLRVGGNTTVPKKIVGPAVAGNEDGLFITSSTMTLSIGDNKASCNIGRLGSPMLVHLVYTPSSLSLMINGQTLANVQFDAATVDLEPDTNNWLGFYSYADLDPIEIDVVSIFGYAVSGVIAKRRFVWGQGVGEIGHINSQYKGDGAFSNFSSSNMTNVVSYPDTSSWAAGAPNNLTVKKNALSPFTQKFPTVVLASHTKSEWLADLYTQNTDKDDALVCVDKGVRFNFHPTAGYDQEVNYALFSSPGTFCKWVDGFSVAVKSDNTASPVYEKTAISDFLDSIGAKTALLAGDSWSTAIDSIKPIFRINNQKTPKKFILCYLTVDGTTKKIRTVFVNGTTVTKIDNAASTASPTQLLFFRFSSTVTDLSSFLSNVNDLSIVLGSDQVVSSDLDIHSFGFFNTKFYNDKVKPSTVLTSLLGSDGNLPAMSSLSYDESTGGVEYKDILFSNYTYLLKQQFGHCYEDVGVKGAWEDYIPLSFLAGVVQDFEGNDAIAVDSIQYNVSYPAPKSIENAVSPVSWTYDDMMAYYDNLSLGFLYLGVFSGYTTYDELKNRTSEWDVSEMVTIVDTSEQFVKSFVALQKATSSITRMEDYETVAAPTQGNTIYFQAFNDFDEIKFEVFDGAILVPPRSYSADKLSLAVGIEYAVPGVVTYPITIKSLELASFAKNRNSFTAIKSRSGKDVYPVVTNGIYYDNSAYNPFKIDKKGLPYLYLGNDSGFTPAGPKQTGWKKGLQIIVPEGADTEYKMDNLLFWVRRPKLFPVTETAFLEFDYGIDQLYFTMQSFQDDATRGIIKIYSKGGVPYLEGSFLQNGNIVNNPVIDIQQWNSIGFAFDNTGLDMGGNVGKITMYPGLSYNNVSYFSTKSALGSTQINYRSWNDILAELWSYWRDGDFSWEDVTVEGTATLKAKELAQIVYRTYIGTEAITVEAPFPLKFKQDDISSFAASSWSSTTIIPV